MLATGLNRMIIASRIKVTMRSFRLFTFAVPFLALGILACGGSKDGQVLAVDPQQPVVEVGETLVLNVTPQTELKDDVLWDVKEPSGGGFLQSQGSRVTYVPPEMAGTYHLVLTATGAGGRALKDVVEVRVLPKAVMDPPALRLAPGGTFQFRARMKGLPREAATWRVAEQDGGEVTPEGHYTAPARPGIYHVTATSVVDPDAVARAEVTVGER